MCVRTLLAKRAGLLLLALVVLCSACAVSIDQIEMASRSSAIFAVPTSAPEKPPVAPPTMPEAAAQPATITELDRPDKGPKAEQAPTDNSTPTESERPDKGPKGNTLGPEESDEDIVPDDRPVQVPDLPLSREALPEPTPEPTPAPDEGPKAADPLSGGGVDFELTRDDIDCEEEDLSAYDETTFLVAHVVVDGNLGAPCFGIPDSRLIDSWEILAAITPSGQLHDLGLFGGYVSSEEDETTLAFVNSLDYEGSIYQMSINLNEAEADPDELRLTMAHEFTHVFTALSTQIDRYTLPNDCGTWDNGDGCYLEDSLMWAWIERFWGGSYIDDYDPYDIPTTSGGEARCRIDSGFLGPYSASSPEEDFAESFSAFVFRLDVDTPGLQAKMDWFAQQPGLVEFQDLAIEAGYEPQRNYFDPCG